MPLWGNVINTRYLDFRIHQCFIECPGQKQLSFLPWVKYKVFSNVVAFRVDLLPPLKHLGIPDHNSVQLISQSHPIRLHIMRPSKELDLSCAGRKPLNDPIDLVWFVTGGTNLRHNHITVQASVQGNASFGPNQTMLLKKVFSCLLFHKLHGCTGLLLMYHSSPCHD